MFKLENTKKLKTALLATSITSLVLATSLFAKNDVSVDGAVKYPTKDAKYSSYHINTQDAKNYNAGRLATKNEIAAWDLDVKPDGTGLPEFDMKHGKPVLDDDGKPKKAEGSVEFGGELYDAQCAMCHGEFGSGGKGYPMLSGGSVASLKNQRLNPADEHPNPESPVRTVGSYWPFVSTLYWYIQDSMPFPHPKSLTNSETYAITAYLLSVNSIKYEGEEIDDEFVLDKEKMMKIKMPNADGFYPEVDTKNPIDGVRNMTKLLSDPKIYGTGTRCMKDCIKEDVNDLLLKVKNDLSTDIQQKPSTKKDLPKLDIKGDVSLGEKIYNESCAACHSNEAIGAPILGNREAWADVTAKGLDQVYTNGINGINAMPPKGGADLTDEQMKEVINYMINSSK